MNEELAFRLGPIKVQKVGHGLYVNIPKALAKYLGITQGAEVQWVIGETVRLEKVENGGDST